MARDKPEPGSADNEPTAKPVAPPYSPNESLIGHMEKAPRPPARPSEKSKSS